MAKRRVVILGGGMAALTAAFELTDPSNPRSADLDVTLYQLGWRLGGKGASGRNLDPDAGARIEEHGLHNLFGFYDNTFRVLRRCYAELGRPAGAPLATWRDTVAPESSAVFLEDGPDGPEPWQIFNPTNRFVPGEGGAWLPLWDTIVMALAFVDINFVKRPEAPPTLDDAGALRARYWPLAKLLHGTARVCLAAYRGERRPQRALRRLARVLRSLPLPGAASAARAVDDVRGEGDLDGARTLERAGAAALRVLRSAAFTALRPHQGGRERRRAWIMLHFACSVMIGVLEDGVLRKGLDSLNHLDFREWITPHTHPDGGLLLESVLMRVLYDSSFAYVDGDTRVPAGQRCAPKANYEAGTLLRGLVRANFAYKGAFGWKFTSGTGDVLFAPLYEVLKRRGVRFRFFHRVDRLRLGAGRPAAQGPGPVEAIELTQQATPTSGSYQPLVDVRGVPCWPAEPDWAQLRDGDALRGLDLESPFVDPPGAQTRTLRRGEDFDDVVLGISVGALGTIGAELAEAHPPWATMLRALRTTRTQALQLWLDRDVAELGWRPIGQPITGFWYDERSALNVWANMSHLLGAERWEGPRAPKHISYFVSPMADDAPLPEGAFGPVVEHADRSAGKATVRASGRALLEQHIRRVLWTAPGASDEDGGFAWGHLVGPPGSTEAPLAGQFVSANVHPSDRYVLSVAGSSQHRLGAHDPAISNLYLAGDWTRCGLNSGAMESATTSGRLCAHALTGFPPRDAILGLDF